MRALSDVINNSRRNHAKEEVIIIYAFKKASKDLTQNGFVDVGFFPAIVCPECGDMVHVITAIDSLGRPFSRLWCERCKLVSIAMVPQKSGASKHQIARWAMAVRARAGGKCQICGALGIHAHHIVPRWKDPTKAIDLNNGIYLCGKCHAEAHQGDSVGIHPDLKKYLEESSNDRYLDPRQTADGDGPTEGPNQIRHLV